MKKLFVAMAALVCSMSMNAQQMKVMKGDKVIATYTAEQADKVVFEEAPAPSGPEYVEIGGLKWATKNLGATTVAGAPATCYGDYYAWGETEPRYTSMTITGASSATFGGWKSEHPGGYISLDHPTYTYDTLDAEHDAATVAYGGSWRTPTKDDFYTLYTACGGPASGFSTLPIGTSSTTAKGIYWCDDYDGVRGLLFSDGTNKVFFPAAGLCCDASFRHGGPGGYYWSSSLRTNDTNPTYIQYLAYDLYFTSLYVSPSDGCDRYNGFTVRPVSE